MLTISRREGNIHQLVLVVLVAKGGNCICGGLFIFCTDSKLQAMSLRGEGKGLGKTLNQDLRIRSKEL